MQFWFLGYVLQFSNTLFSLLVCLIFPNIFTIFTKLSCYFFCTNDPIPIHWVNLMTLSSTEFVPLTIQWPGKGNGTPLQYSCLEKSQGREAWWATVHGIATSRTWWSDWALSTTIWWEELLGLVSVDKHLPFNSNLLDYQDSPYLTLHARQQNGNSLKTEKKQKLPEKQTEMREIRKEKGEVMIPSCQFQESFRLFT